MARVGDKDEFGYMNREGLFRKNRKDSGHYHSNWLSTIYPRLFLARNLLREDGVIFVSIDDNEVHNLRMLMNEVFGEESFVGLITIGMIPFKEDDICLDFFPGSSTTAHAALELDKEDNGNRKFIMVQMPEACDEKSGAYKAGYKTIADIGKERIRRVIQNIEKE